MYSDTINPKVNKMFDELRRKVSETIDISPTREMAADNISRIVGSEVSLRSKTMFSDMYSALSKKVLDALPDVKQQNKFYEANLRKELFDKYDFTVSTDKVDYKELNRLGVSLEIGGGTILAGGAGIALYTTLSNALISTVAVPVGIVAAAGVGAFCASYFKGVPKVNKNKFKEAVNNYLDTLERDFLAWFDAIEEYFNKRVKEILA